MSPSVEPAAAQAPAPAPAAAPAATPAPIPAPQQSRREVIAEKIRASSNAAAPIATSPVATTEPTQAQVKQRPAMPKSIKKELEVHWGAVPDELAEAIVRQASGLEHMERYKTQAQQAEELLNEFKPYEMLLKTENTTPKQAIASLLQTAALLRTGTPAQKNYAAATMMRQFGISIEGVNSILSGGMNNDAAAGAVPLEPLWREIQQLKQVMSEGQAVQRQAFDQRVGQAIERFSALPSSTHFDAVREDMAEIMNTPKFAAETQGLDELVILQKAYEKAIRLNDSVFSEVQRSRQLEAEKARQSEAAKAAAVQVSGAPATGKVSHADPKDRREIIRQQLNRVTSR